MIFDYYFINTFIIVYIFFSWSYSAPERSIWKIFTNKIDKHIIWVGLNHKWNMFSNPIKSLEHLEAVITLSNGSTCNWQALNIDQLGYFKAFLSMRHRKFQRTIFAGGSNVAKSALINFLKKKYSSSEIKPIKIELFVKYQETPPVEKPEMAWPLAQKYLVYLWEENL